MKMTTKTIIKILPIDKEVKDKFESEYDSFPQDKKYEADRMLWGYFDTLYALKLEENTQLLLLEAKEKKVKLDKNFYKKVREKTEKEIAELSIKSVDSASLEEARRAMEIIVKEIQASKSKTSN